MKRKWTLVLAVVVALTLGLTGCAKKGSLNGAETIATLDDTQIPLGEVNLLLRYQEAQMETYYSGMFGSNIYRQDLTGNGTIYGETAKEGLLTEMEQMYILEAEAANYDAALPDEEKNAIADAAAQFVADNDAKTLQAIAADQATVEHVLTLMTIQQKMKDALTSDVDAEVSDEDAAQKKISYVFVSTAGTERDEEGNTVDLTDEEKAEKKAVLQAVLDSAKKSGDLDAAAEEQELTASTTTFGADSQTPAEEVRRAADKLREGEFSEIIEAENAYYVIQLVSSLDREATDNKKETIVQQRRDDLFAEKYAELQKDHTFESKADVLAKLTFDRTYTLKAEESTEGTQAE